MLSSAPYHRNGEGWPLATSQSLTTPPLYTTLSTTLKSEEPPLAGRISFWKKINKYELYILRVSKLKVTSNP